MSGYLKIRTVPVWNRKAIAQPRHAQFSRATSL